MPIVTTHAGSLPRPAELDHLYASRSRGEAVDEARFRELVAAATTSVVREQLALGIDVVNNGEAPRESFLTYVRERLSGFDGTTRRPVMADLTEFPSLVAMKRAQAAGGQRVSPLRPPACCGPVTYADPLPMQAEVDGFAAALDAGRRSGIGWASDTFLTAVSPGLVAAAMDNRHYPDDDGYLDAVAEALGAEYQFIAMSGHILQIDAPDLAMERHTRFAGRPLDDFLPFVERVVTGINRAVAGIDPSRIRLHVCWGNYDGPHNHDIPLADILPLLLDAQVGWLVLPFANPRHAHEYRLLSDLPPTMGVVAGVIETTHNYIEHPQVVADRIDRVLDVVGDASRVQAGTDCGFATFAGLGDVASEVAWEKLRSLVAGAELAGR
ncbi:MAG: cobalamin-independent methionine synthase II family protein [Acidimicrobiales bacterium]